MIYLASLTEEIEDKIKGYYIIKTKEELDKVIANNKENNKVIIKKGFAREYFTPSGLHSYIENVRKVNRNVIVEVDTGSNVLTLDKFVGQLAKANSKMKMLELLSAYPKEFIDTIQFLTSERQKENNELLTASANVSQMQYTIDELKKQVENAEHALDIERNNKNFVQSKLSSLVNRINYQYNLDIDESKLFKVNENSFDKVLYIKEITRVQYTDSLIYYLKEILKILYSMPTRLLVIESFYATGKERLYPNLKPHYKLNQQDILSEDILMLGMQPKVMKDILANSNRTSILIVLDRAGFGMNHIIGDNVELLYTVSDTNDVPDSVPRNRIISYSEDTLFVPYMEDFKDLDEDKRTSRYSSTEIIKQIISLIEGKKVVV